jgi:uncharacterized protein YmfQ (DUF2313 family)
MNHLDLLKLSLPPEAYDPTAPNILADLTADGNALDRALQSADGLTNEFDPRTAYSLLPDWERVAGIVPAPMRRTLLPGNYGYGLSNIASFSRASTATYFDANGVLQTAAANVPRFQNGQLLIEGAGTNYTYASEALNNAAYWTGCTVTASAQLFGGLVPFWNVAKKTAGSSEPIYQWSGLAAVNGDVATETVAVMAGNSSQISIGVYASVSGWGVNADSTASIISGPGAIVQHAGGWFDVTGLSAVTPTLIRITRTFRQAENVGSFFYPDTAASTTLGASNLITRVMTERGSAWSSYITTTNAPATRAADVCDVWVPQTLEQRRAALNAKIIERGGQSRGYFLAIAARYGFPNATITEYRRSTCNDNCNSVLVGPNDLFVWKITLPATGGSFVATCNSSCDTALGGWGHALVEAAILDDKPAHTTVLFAYQ